MTINRDEEPPARQLEEGTAGGSASGRCRRRQPTRYRSRRTHRGRPGHPEEGRPEQAAMTRISPAEPAAKSA